MENKETYTPQEVAEIGTLYGELAAARKILSGEESEFFRGITKRYSKAIQGHLEASQGIPENVAESFSPTVEVMQRDTRKGLETVELFEPFSM